MAKIQTADRRKGRQTGRQNKGQTYKKRKIKRTCLQTDKMKEIYRDRQTDGQKQMIDRQWE